MITWYAAPSPTEEGFYACVRRAAGVHTVESDGHYTESGAKREANRLNQQHQREQARLAQTARPGRIPAGFYTDKDAA